MWGRTACPIPHSAILLGLPVTALPRLLSTPAAHFLPSYCLNECFFFISLVVGLPYSSIFCQFWWFLFLNCCCPSLGCSRRHSVTTYTSILAGSSVPLILKQAQSQLDRAHLPLFFFFLLLEVEMETCFSWIHLVEFS